MLTVQSQPIDGAKNGAQDGRTDRWRDGRTDEWVDGPIRRHVDRNQRVKVKVKWTAAMMVAALRTARLLRDAIASVQGKQENENEKDKVRTRKTFVLFD